MILAAWFTWISLGLFVSAIAYCLLEEYIESKKKNDMGYLILGYVTVTMYFIIMIRM